MPLSGKVGQQLTTPGQGLRREWGIAADEAGRELLDRGFGLGPGHGLLGGHHLGNTRGNTCGESGFGDSGFGDSGLGEGRPLLTKVSTGGRFVTQPAFFMLIDF